MKTGFLAALVVILVSGCLPPLKEDEHLLANMMLREPEQFRFFVDHQDSLEIQIIYTQINRGANNQPSFKSFYFNVDSCNYFYPASTVKLPVALLALEKLKHLNIQGVNKSTTMFNDSVYSGQFSALRDTTSESGLPSMAHYIKKILITSDNDAHNRLYEFMGQHDANALLRQKGYAIRLLHRLDRALSPDQNRHTEAVRFVRDDSILFCQDMLVNDSIPKSETVMKGVGHIEHDSLVKSPFDFGYKNRFPLSDQQHLLRALLFPETVETKSRFDIAEEDRRFVLRYMSQLPTETKFPPYATDTAYYPSYAKYLMFGGSREAIPPSIRIFNKIGDAYGYLIDNAYIVDFDEGVEFMLSAVIHASTDGVYNDSEYEYETIGYPFMRNLGVLIYNYEVNRRRANKPDLREFKFQYDK